MPDAEIPPALLHLTVDIVSAYVANNSVPPAELPSLIKRTYEALLEEHQGTPIAPKPAVSIKKSIAPDYIVCLEDGKKLTMLKRYLRSRYGLSPAEYRQRWGLSADYPMVAPNYAERRSLFAKKIGLGKSQHNPNKRRRG